MGPSADIWFLAYLRDTLLVLATVEDGPGDTAGVLALEEKRLGLAVLETEDLAVATDVQLTLTVSKKTCQHFCHGGPLLFIPPLVCSCRSIIISPSIAMSSVSRDPSISRPFAFAKSVPPPNPRPRTFPTGFGPRSHFPAVNYFERAKKAYLSRVDPLAGEAIVVRSHCGGLLSRLSVVGRCFLEGAMFQRRFSSISFRSEVVR